MEWVEWFAEACLSVPTLLFGCDDPEPGTKQHRELELLARREYVEECAKPEEQQDPERVRQLRIRNLELGIKGAQFDVAAYGHEAIAWHRSAAQAVCCDGANIAYKRIAASFTARAQYYRVRVRQAQEELSAALERRPIRIVEDARIELPPGAVEDMEDVAAIDMCTACHKQLKEAVYAEELLRAKSEAVADYYHSIAEEQAEAGPSPEQQEGAEPIEKAACLADEDQQQQEASSPDLPTGMLDLMKRLDLQHLSSDDEPDVAEAADSEGSLGSPLQQQGDQAAVLHLRQQKCQQAVGVS